MRFHEHRLSATPLPIVAQAFLLIAKMVKNSLQNCHASIEVFESQINIVILGYFCLPPPFISSQVMKDPFITKS